LQNIQSQGTLTATLAREEEKLLACIHCGLCLEACPTYVVTGDENDGPRGRLYLMRAVGEGRLAADSPAFERHIDRCLGCRACEQVCPAGVEYGQLLEAARGQLFESHPKRGFSYGVLRLVLKHVWLHPARLKFAFAISRLFRDSGVARLLRKSGIAKLFSARLEFALALLESSAPGLQSKRNNSKRNTAARSASDSIEPVLLFTGCVGEGLFARVNRATARVLEVNDFPVQTPSQQVCCGALHAHAGDLEGARTLARQNIVAFEANDGTPVITNAGGCGAMLVSYAHLLADDAAFAERARSFSARVRDVGQQLETVETRAAEAVTQQAVTYDASCHLLYGQHAADASLKMMGAVVDQGFVKLEGSERCCGGAGIYNLLEPDLSGEVLNEKLAAIRNSGAQVLASGNPGCQMQIGAGALLAGMDLIVCHPVELLDDAYASSGEYEAADKRE
jgi:glycolate oxidase iron-sulfur subunit